MSASLSLILLVEFFHFLLIRCLVALIHDHLTGHQIWLGVLLVIWHHSNHLRVVEHLVRNLPIVLLHLLHTHAHIIHVGWHAAHLVCCLHLSCSVHIEI